jgi:hypothetical protein
MAINFPDSPSNGDTVTVGDKTWTWNGSTWDVVVSTPISNQIIDADGDTRVHVEESPDEDYLRFDTAGTERMTINPSGNVAMTGDLTVTGNLAVGSNTDVEASIANLESRPVETKTASYVLVAADVNKRIVMNNAGATTITVNDSVFAAGDTVWIHNIGAGTTTVTAGTATVDTAGSLDVGQWEGGSLYFTSASSAIFFRGGGAGLDIQFLVVGGGGAGGEPNAGGSGGGGGGSGVGRTGTLTVERGVSVDVEVGAGGAVGGSFSAVGAPGGPSRFGSIDGGGGGAGKSPASVGGGDGSNGGGGNAGSGVQPGGRATSAFGFDGGDGAASGNIIPSGGGAGAANAGVDATLSPYKAGDGGDGLVSTIISTSDATTYSVGEVVSTDVYYGGGGGGSVYDSSAIGVGGDGGGGDGGAGNAGGATAGTANTGGGGGGGNRDTSGGREAPGAGGSGVVIIRFATSYGTPTVGAGLTSSNFTDGTDTVYIFTAGTDTISWS